ncbi:hypothetical protein B0H14DRAFT_2412365, partial [Mycena olivaceomarginata]
LPPINFFLRHPDISHARQAGTGEWLLADPLFKKWESGSGRTLWCRVIRVLLTFTIRMGTNQLETYSGCMETVPMCVHASMIPVMY